MKKIIDFITGSTLFIIISIAVIYVFYIVTSLKFIALFVLLVSPLVLIIIKRNYKNALTVKQANQIYKLGIITVVGLGFLIITSYNAYNMYLQSKLLNGKVFKEEVIAQTYDGDEEERTNYYYQLFHKEDRLKSELVELFILLLAIGSPLYVIYGVDKLQKEVQNLKPNKLYHENI